MTQAMTYIISNKGVDTEASYPYTAEDGTCAYNAANSGATLTGFVNVNTGDESDLQVKTYAGPTSVAIDASQSSFQFYSGGVYYEPACSSTQLDHGVLSIGWGTSSGTQYWLVKNSWGTSWGMSGFIMMSRNKNNNCGIATMATLPQC
jgi:cathepsin L